METTTTEGSLREEIEDHLGQAQGLWARWHRSLSSPDQNLAAAWRSSEERLHDHLPALQRGGLKAVVEVYLAALASDELDRLAVVAFALSAIAPGREPLLAAMMRAEGPRLQALRRGVELARDPGFLALLDRRFEAAPARVQAAVLDLRRFGRDDPGPHTLDLLLGSDLACQVAAARAVRHARSELAVDRAVDLAMMAPHPEVRNGAIESGLYAGQAEAWSACLQTVRAGVPGRGALLLPIALLGTIAEHRLVIDGLADEETRADAIWALGFAGSVAAADACLELLAQELHPAAAAEALGAITGLDLRREGLAVADAEGPSGRAARLSHDQALPLPDIPGVIRWWNRNRARFSADERYIGGRPRSANALQEALEHGPTRRRPPLALELAIRTSRRYVVTPDAFSAQQRREMAAYATLRPSDLRSHPRARFLSPL